MSGARSRVSLPPTPIFAQLSLLQTLLAESGDPTHLLDPPAVCALSGEFIARLRSEDATQLAFDHSFFGPIA